MKTTSILVLAAILPLVACQSSDEPQIVNAGSGQDSAQGQTVEAMAMSTFELGKVP